MEERGRVEGIKGGRKRKSGRVEGVHNLTECGTKRLEGCMEDIVLSGYSEKVERGGRPYGRQGVCVQIGLHDMAEYLYLAKPNWREKHSEQEGLKQLPAAIADRWTSWRYYGVDWDVGSIVKMLEKYGHIPSVSWIHAAVVGNQSDKLMKLPSYFIGGHFIGFGCSLQRLFCLLYLTEVDVLVMDVEGSEISIFQNYDWVIKPSYISVEVHGDHDNPSITDAAALYHHEAIVDSILSEQGYSLLNKEYTNLNTTGYCTCELQYQL